ncbi:uncharacterized protein LOC117329593 isoform X2 [Pecten maximus]|uniref:uncharacterized protein LOC117329593 isoform X2 n=1 Tax=Pecten maximus TaxID=6579 RepID=UPI001458D8E3|nr:uncharacterized protein LOC117329593 isoform X2 [Pecten maximus]
MASDHVDHDIDDDIVYRVNSLLDVLGHRSAPVKDVDDIGVEHFVLMYRHVTGEVIPGSTYINSRRDGVKVVQFIIDSLADDIFGIPMDHVTGVGIVNGNRRMIADLLEIFNSIMLQTNVEEEARNHEESNSLDDLSTPLRDVLLCLQNEVEYLAESAIIQKTQRAAFHKAKDVFTQTTPISKTTAINSPIVWKDVLQTIQRGDLGVKQQPRKRAMQMSKNTSNYLTQSYFPSKKVLTPKYDNPMSKSTGCLTRRTLSGNIRPRTRKSVMSKTTSTTSPEVHNELRGQPELIRGSVSLLKELSREDRQCPQFPTQRRANIESSSNYLRSLPSNKRSQPAQQRTKILSTDNNNNIQLTDVQRSCEAVRPSVSDSRRSKPQYQRPMKKMVKPKPVISSKVRRKSSTGSTSSIYPSSDTFMTSKDLVCYNEKMIELTDQVKSIRERRQEINKQLLQEEKKSLCLLENLILKEIRLTKSIEDRRRRPRGIYVL